MAHPVVLLSLVVALALVAPGCSDDDDPEGTQPPAPTQPEPKPPAAERHKVVLHLDRETARPGETIELTVENRAATRLEYGLAYRLEQETEDGWRWINRDAAFALILKIVEPGRREREAIRLPDDLDPGRYRIVKSFTAVGLDRKLRASVEFDVT